MISPILERTADGKPSLHVFVATDANFLTGALVTIVSASLNSGEGTRLHFHLMHDGVDEETLRWFDECARPFLKRNFLEYETTDRARLDKLPLHTGALTRSTYARLLIAHNHSELDKALYVDCDIIVQKDLGELDRIDLGDKRIAAVVDECGTLGASQDRAILAKLGTDPERPYVNAGLLLLNLDLWRRENVYEESMRLLATHGEVFVFHDQTVLNIVAAGRCLTLDAKWNMLVNVQPEAEKYTYPFRVNYHTTTGYKPWFIDRTSQCQIVRLFYRYLDRTRWNERPRNEVKFPYTGHARHPFTRKLRATLRDIGNEIANRFRKTRRYRIIR